MNIDFVNGHCFYCNYSKDKAENNLPSSPAECFMCELSNTSIASLVPYRKSFIHRECRKYIHLFETKHLQVNFINRESVVINCEICLEERGKMIKCIINNCYRYSHILCGKIYDQIVDSNHIPVSNNKLIYEISIMSVLFIMS